MYEVWAPALIALACSLAAGFILGTPRAIWPENYRPNGWIVASFLILAIGFCAFFAHKVDQRLLEQRFECVAQDNIVCVRYSPYDSMAAGVLLLIAIFFLFFLAWGYSWVAGKMIGRLWPSDTRCHG